MTQLRLCTELLSMKRCHVTLFGIKKRLFIRNVDKRIKTGYI